MPDFQFAAVVVITGLVVVFVVLFLLILFIRAISFLGNDKNNNKKSEMKRQEAPAAPVETASVAPQIVVEEGIPGDVIAVISAAVAAMMGGVSSKDFVLRSVKRSRKARPVWGMAGISENTRPF